MSCDLQRLHPGLSLEVAEAICGYVPAGVDGAAWEPVADLARGWVAAACPAGRPRALQLLWAASRLAIWCADGHVPLQPASVFKTSTLERFCAVALAGSQPTTQATVRSSLRALARANAARTLPPDPPAYPRLARRAPYSVAEVAGLFHLVETQPSVSRRRGLKAILLCGLGAGCDTVDLRFLRGTDVTVEERPDGSSMTWLRISGSRSRSVPVLDRYSPDLVELANSVGERLLLGGEKATRRNVCDHLLAHVTEGLDLPRIDPARLRATWLVEHLTAGTRLDVLLVAAGLSTPATLGDLLPYVQPLAPESAADLLRAGVFR